jgi:hypothetical protein
LGVSTPSEKQNPESNDKTDPLRDEVAPRRLSENPLGTPLDFGVSRLTLY